MGPDRYTTILGAHQGDLNRKRVGFTRGEGNTLHGVVSFRATGVVGNSHILECSPGGALGKKITHFDVRIFFKWVVSTTNYPP